VPTEHGGRRPATLRQWIALVAVDLREHFTVCQATKPATDRDASGNPGPVQIVEGLAAKIMRRAPSPISTQSLIFRIPVICRFFAHSFASHAHRNASIHVPHLKLSKRRKKRGRHVGITEWLLVWLIANALFVVWRVLVVSQAEARDLSVRRRGAGRPLSQQALRGRLGQ
jgi:hypothetical protein